MVSIENIISALRNKGVRKDKLIEVDKAYRIAKDIHKNQVRQSGEPYIIHPLNVAQNLIDMEVYDPDTISAALLHDTIEDAEDEFTKEDIADLINPTVAELVDGVTKMRKMDFSSKSELILANTRKIINGLTKDVRIILIKLADRLHNMRTLEFKSKEKQVDNARETAQVFIPLALSIGAYKVKGELEDLSLYYTDRDSYLRIEEEVEKQKEIKKNYLDEVESKIKELLSEKNIPNEIVFREKNVGNIFKDINRGYKIEDMYDLFYLKVLVDEIEDCYRTLYYVHSNFKPLNGRYKDYICNQRTNFYQSLHTTVSLESPDKDICLPNRTIVLPKTHTHHKGIEEIAKVKIRTFDMNKVAAYGIPAYWNIKNGLTIEETQKEINKLPFDKRLKELNAMFSDNRSFYKQAKQELLEDHVYVYGYDGSIIELPHDATALDFLTQEYPELLDQATGAIINGREEPLSQTLNNYDIVKINTKGEINRSNWEESAKTSTAKQKIKSLIN